MVQVTIITRDGVEHRVEGQAGYSVMEIIREAGIDELLALCGGVCSCATCHVYVDPATPGLSELSQDEDDLLDSSDARKPTSRLSCQLTVEEAMAGARFEIAPEE